MADEPAPLADVEPDTTGEWAPLADGADAADEPTPLADEPTPVANDEPAPLAAAEPDTTDEPAPLALCCSNCGSPIALAPDIMAELHPVMKDAVFSYELDLLGRDDCCVYSATNPGDVRFDVVRVDAQRALTAEGFGVRRRVALTGSATPEHSWFPPYCWRMCSCAQCLAHLGWGFELPRNLLDLVAETTPVAPAESADVADITVGAAGAPGRAAAPPLASPRASGCEFLGLILTRLREKRVSRSACSAPPRAPRLAAGLLARSGLLRRGDLGGDEDASDGAAVASLASRRARLFRLLGLLGISAARGRGGGAALAAESAGRDAMDVNDDGDAAANELESRMALGTPEPPDLEESSRAPRDRTAAGRAAEAQGPEESPEEQRAQNEGW